MSDGMRERSQNHRTQEPLDWSSFFPTVESLNADEVLQSSAAKGKHSRPSVPFKEILTKDRGGFVLVWLTLPFVSCFWHFKFSFQLYHLCPASAFLLREGGRNKEHQTIRERTKSESSGLLQSFNPSKVWGSITGRKSRRVPLACTPRTHPCTHVRFHEPWTLFWSIPGHGSNTSFAEAHLETLVSLQTAASTATTEKTDKRR